MPYGPDLEQVYDSILGCFKRAWDDGAAAVNGGVTPEVEWPDEPQRQTPLSKGAEPWARVTIKHALRGGTSIGNGRTAAEGFVKVNIFLPAGKRGLAAASRLGKVAVAAFESQRTGDVWFTDVLPEEVGVDGAWFQYDVTAKFHYHNHR